MLEELLLKLKSRTDDQYLLDYIDWLIENKDIINNKCCVDGKYWVNTEIWIKNDTHDVFNTIKFISIHNVFKPTYFAIRLLTEPGRNYVMNTWEDVEDSIGLMQMNMFKDVYKEDTNTYPYRLVLETIEPGIINKLVNKTSEIENNDCEPLRIFQDTFRKHVREKYSDRGIYYVINITEFLKDLKEKLNIN